MREKKKRLGGKASASACT